MDEYPKLAKRSDTKAGDPERLHSVPQSSNRNRNKRKMIKEAGLDPTGEKTGKCY